MSLLLIITSYHKITPGQCSEKRLEQGQLSIGRAPECDWHLPDPERLVSSQHCVVQCRDGVYYLTDTSTNGVLFKNSGVQLRRGNSERLHDGDVVLLGNYVLEVRLESRAVPAPVLAQDPFAAVASPVPAAPGFDELLRNMSAGANAFAGSVAGDPFAQGAGQSGQDTQPNLFDFLSPSHSGSTADVGHSLDDHVAAQHQYFSAPNVHAVGPAEVPAQSAPGFVGIPEDWDVSAPSPALGSVAVADPFASVLAPAQPESGLAAVAEAAAPVALPTVTPAAEDLLQAFLRGAGVEQLAVQPAERVAQMEALGRSYRRMVEGLMDVLRARSSLKGEFRMSHTMIQPVENNPLKFAPNVEEALLLLLRPSNSAFMAPDQAVSESFADLKAHQLAVMAGTQAALKHLLKRFEPAALEARLDSPGLLATLLPGAQQGRYWGLFTELYGRLSREAEDDFQALFGREFARAYEEQMAHVQRR